MDENLANSEREVFESQAPGLYKGSGRDEKQKARGKIFLKKKGPIALIIGLIFGVGGLIGGAQIMQPFSLVEQLRETFNSMQTSVDVRSNRFLYYQMNANRVKDPVKGKIFSANTFKITESQATKLAAQGIEYDDNYNGHRVLKFDDGTGKIQIVTADVDTANKIGNGAVDFATIYKENSDFYNGYNKGSMTWRGAIANWFGTTTVKFLRSNKITRNLFQDFQKKVEAENNGNSRTAALELMAKGTDKITEGGYKTTGAQKEESYEEDGKTKTHWVDVENVKDFKLGGGESRIGSNNSPSGGGVIERSSMNNKEAVSKKLNGISGNVTKGANIACTVFNVLGGVSALVTASEALQVMSLVTGYLEATDKVKAGEGVDSPINDLTNALNEKKPVTYEVLESISINSNEVQGKTKPVDEEKSAMEASGIAALYGGGAVNPKDPSVQSFNFSGNMGMILRGVGLSASFFEACTVARVMSAGVNIGMDAASTAACVLGLVGAPFTFGGSAVAACTPLAVNAISGVALGMAIGTAVAGVISVITPTVANMLTRDLIADIGGEDLGNALTFGANMYMGNTYRANGGALATREQYIAFKTAQQEVIANNAKYERQNRSPFDMSSKYTFMGTLVNQAIKFASTSSVMSAITSMSSAVTSSMVAMSPSVSAYDLSQSLPSDEEWQETCPYLWSIGAVGDAACNPYTVTDLSTMNIDPVDVISKLNDPNGDGDYEDSNFLDEETSDGNVIIKAGSPLAKYIQFCGGRTSGFGMTDWNIVNQLSNFGQVETQNSFVNNMTNSAIGAVPILGDVIDIVANEQAKKNVGYITGESCVAGNNVSDEEAPGWDTAKYYQRFIEDQSLAETMGLFKNGKSAVTAYLDEYYEENPLDNSYEGILARYSGLSKDDVIALLDFIDYSLYVANYDPSERYVFGSLEIPKKEDKKILLEDKNKENFYNIWWYNNIYDRVGRVETRAKKAEYTVC